MSKFDRILSRLNPHDPWHEDAEITFNAQAHSDKHLERILVYTAPDCTDTTAGPAFYSPYSGQLKWVRASVDVAPSATYKVDVLVDGNTIFDGSNYCEIRPSYKFAEMAYPDTLGIVGVDQGANEPTPITVQVNDASDATGVLVVYIGLSLEP